jgi:hypothetical protein
LLLAQLGKDKLSPLDVKQQMNGREVRNANIGEIEREDALKTVCHKSEPEVSD